jgi:cell division protease FtsH
MSEKLGPLSFGKKEQEIFLGREISQHRDYSEHTAIDIDNEVKRLVMENYERAKIILRANMKALRAIAEALLEREVLEGAEIEQIIREAAAAPS